MAISTRVLATDARDLTGNYTVTLDSSAASGEFLVATVIPQFDAWQTWTGQSVTMSGWTLLDAHITPNGDYYPNCWIFYKTAGSEPSSYSINTTVPSPASNVNTIITASTGVDLGNPIAASPVWDDGGGPSGASPSLTLGDPGRAFWIAANHEWTDGNAIRNYNWSPPAVELLDSLSVWCFAGWAYEDRDAAGSTGSRPWTVADYNGNTVSLNGGFALRAAGSHPSSPAPNRFFLAL